MSKVNICVHIIDAIQKHAESFPDIEIYGWLIGYDFNNQLFVVASVPCKQYKAQNQLIAEPSHEEVMEISKTIPKGVGVVGIYHSHVGIVFHSAADNQTVKQFASVYPYFLSIVTNIKETKYYQLNEEEIEELSVNLYKEKNLVQSKFETLITLQTNEEFQNIPQLSSQIRELFESTKIEKLYINNVEIQDDVLVSRIENKKCKVKLEGFQAPLETNQKPIINLQLESNILSHKSFRIKEIHSLIIQSFIDDMYHKLGKTEMIDSELNLPETLEMDLDCFTWKFYINRKDESFIDFANLLDFRLKFMSFRDEKQRNRLIMELTDLS